MVSTSVNRALIGTELSCSVSSCIHSAGMLLQNEYRENTACPPAPLLYAMVTGCVIDLQMWSGIRPRKAIWELDLNLGPSLKMDQIKWRTQLGFWFWTQHSKGHVTHFIHNSLEGNIANTLGNKESFYFKSNRWGGPFEKPIGSNLAAQIHSRYAVPALCWCGYW